MKTKPLIAVGYLFIFLAIQTVVQVAALAIEWMILGKEITELDAIGLLVSTIVFSLITIGLFTGLKWTPVSREYIVSRPWIVLFWCFIAALGAVIPSSFLQEQLPEWPESIQQQIDHLSEMMLQLMNVPGGYAALCILAPIAEEVVFRGAILRKLMEWKPQHRWLMITLSALLFALAHMNPAQFLHPFLIGLLLGWMYVRTGSILPGIVYHCVNNSVAYLTTRLYQDPDVTLTQILGSTSRVLMAVAFSLLIFVPAIYQLHLWMRKKN